jgi:hypothetical protein
MEGVSHFIADRQKISSFVISIAINLISPPFCRLLLCHPDGQAVSNSYTDMLYSSVYFTIIMVDRTSGQHLVVASRFWCSEATAILKQFSVKRHSYQFDKLQGIDIAVAQSTVFLYSIFLPRYHISFEFSLFLIFCLFLSSRCEHK